MRHPRLFTVSDHKSALLQCPSYKTHFKIILEVTRFVSGLEPS